ncbi:MAG: hypothetical protein O9331_14380 [Acidovorax sp.]|nr:hypothetical protein [Acidovorax sp.]
MAQQHLAVERARPARPNATLKPTMAQMQSAIASAVEIGPEASNVAKLTPPVTTAMPTSLISQLQTVALTLVVTSPSAIPAVFAWRRWCGMHGDAFAWLYLLLALVTTAFWLAVAFIHWQTRLQKAKAQLFDKDG